MAIMRMPKPARPLDEVDFTKLNHTELVQLAQFNEIPGASPALPREVLIYVLDPLEDVGVPNPLDRTRQRIASWLERYWEKFAMQVPWEKPSGALRISDMEAAKFWIENRHQIT